MTAELHEAIAAEVELADLAEPGDVVTTWVVVAAIESPDSRDVAYVTLYPNGQIPTHIAAGLLHCGLDTLGVRPDD